MNSKAPLTIALTKGRILHETLPLLRSTGVELPPSAGDDRHLMFDSACGSYRFLVVRGGDITTYVQLGAAAVGIIGRDMLLEAGGDSLYELLDLKIARCRLMTAALADRPAIDAELLLRVATKYVNIARRHYAAGSRRVQLVRLYGSLELAPHIGIADEIVDIVDTGGTLASNGLQPLELIAEVSARLAVNKAAMRIYHDEIQALRERLAAAVAEAKSGSDA